MNYIKRYYFEFVKQTDSQNISDIKKSSVKSTVCVNREDYVKSLEPEKYFEYKKPHDVNLTDSKNE